jgi:uncharacterized lipoprotein YddW (UPF0748 family)
MKRWFWTAFLSVAMLSVTVSAMNLPNPQTRGVWISGSYLQGGPSAIETLMRNLSAANFNTIYVDVWYQGSTIYPSQVVQDAGGPVQNPVFAGTDPLKTTIQIAHQYGIEVFAWFEYGFMVGNSGDSTNIPTILKDHPDWAMVQRDTTKDFFHNIYGYFFAVDPSVSAASNFIVNLFTECAKNYPDLDGVESDIETDTTVSYSDTSRTRFMQETGEPDPLTLPNNDPTWLSWRCLQITNVVKRIYQGVKEVNPECVVSAAVPPPYMSDYMLESWDMWSKSGYLDMAEPMLYLNTSDFDNQMSLCSNYIPQGFQLSPGIDMSSAGSGSNRVPNTIYEIQDAVRRNVAGVTVWYYGYLNTSPGAYSELKSEVFPEKTLPSYDDLVMDNANSGLFSSAGSWTTERGGYDDSYLSAQAVQGDTAIFSVRILRSGDYTLYGYWTGDSSSNCSNAIVRTSTAIFVKSDTVNQKINLNAWSYVDKFQLNSGDTVTIKLTGTGGGNLIADAFRLRRANPFILSDYAVPDSETILLKFSNPLLNPVSSQTTVSTSLAKTNVNFFVDPVDNTILHVVVPILQQGMPFTVNVEDLLDISYDTLNVTQTLSYDPDSTTFVIDDETPNSFLTQSGNWTEDTSGAAINGEFWAAKQGSQVARAQWGPLQIMTDGYCDVYAHIPKTQLPLTGRCLYIVLDHFGTDSIYISQTSAEGKWTELGNFPLRAGDPFAASLSSVAGSDTSEYVAADAIMLVRAVQVTGVKQVPTIPQGFAIFQNYPNPFNPSTVISFQLKDKAAVYVTVYNSLGQRVKELADGETYPPGRESVKFNGSRMPSGLYFALVRIEGESFEGRKVLKMLLLK